jgi:regulator of PEP synthase PpsR (kinase-PPPase family)
MAKKEPTKKSAPQPKNGRKRYEIHVISGSTGDLLYRLASMAATQFSDVNFTIIPHPLADTHEKLRKVLEGITTRQAMVIHGLADVTAKQLVRSYCVQQRLWHFDATGPLFDFIADCVGQLSDNDLSLLHQVDEAYEERIAAMEFAMEHDDSLGLATLKEADIVIVGLSRMSKSPTMYYLSSRGYKVANVSIAPVTGFPPQLNRIRKKKVVALTMQPKRLHEIRVERMKAAGAPGTDYDNLNSVIREVLDCERECERRGYPIIDVTNFTVEQTAAHILKALGLIPK